MKLSPECEFEEEFGYLQACQIIGEFPEDTPFQTQWDRVSGITAQLEKSRSELSVFTPPALILARESQNPGVLEQLAQASEIHRYRDGKHHWQITVYHEPVPDFLSSSINRDIEQAVSPSSHEGDGSKWFVTGIYRLFGDAQTVLMDELLRTFLLAFLLITPLIVLFIRDAALGLLATIGNVFPIVTFFGTLGYLGIRIDVATMIIASVAFGIAVDDTIHFLASLKKFSATHGMGREAISRAIRQSGSAILKTSLIIALGMLAFLLSDFGPSRRFAAFTAVVLFLAVIADLVLLPALIAGPLRAIFKKRQ